MMSNMFISRAYEDSVEKSNANPTPLLTTNGKSVTSILIPPNPSLVPKQRVYTGIGIDSKEKEDSMEFLRDCKITSQVRLIASSPRWIIQSMDEHGVDKFVGGDEFYITYTDSSRSRETSTAVAHVTDLKNGRYELDFVTTPMDPNPENLSGTGLLRIYFQYSCGIGFLPPMTKLDWNIGGTSSFFAKVENIQMPPIRIFQYPSLGDICFREPQFETLIGVGDSVLNNFVRNKSANIPNTMKGKLRGPLTTATVQDKVLFIENEYGSYIKSHRVALLVGSSTWDIIHNDDNDDPYFADHFRAVRAYVKKLKNHFPNTTLIWKAPSALHVHRVACRNEYYCSLRTKCLSTSRAEFLYRGQKKKSWRNSVFPFWTPTRLTIYRRNGQRRTTEDTTTVS